MCSGTVRCRRGRRVLRLRSGPGRGRQRSVAGRWRPRSSAIRPGLGRVHDHVGRPRAGRRVLGELDPAVAFGVGQMVDDCQLAATGLERCCRGQVNVEVLTVPQPRVELVCLVRCRHLRRSPEPNGIGMRGQFRAGIDHTRARSAAQNLVDWATRRTAGTTLRPPAPCRGGCR